MMIGEDLLGDNLYIKAGKTDQLLSFQLSLIQFGSPTQVFSEPK